MQHNQHIAELAPLLSGFGIGHVVISPGSRNAPLTQLFTSDDSFRCTSIVDERSAGYVALGMARQLDQPVAVVTTSGTAVLNLAPAVAEAYHQEIPLLVLTADRPLEVIPQFNNQWIDQEAPFYSFTRGSLQLPMLYQEPEDLEQMTGHVERLLAEATTGTRGPVHINVPLAEPLYEKLPSPLLGKRGPVSGTHGKQNVPGEPEQAVPASISADSKILVLAGMGLPDKKIRTSLERLVQSRQAVVVAENISNLAAEDFCLHPELLMAASGEDQRNDLKPDLLLSFGGQMVSKRLKLFLQSIRDLEKVEVVGDVASYIDALAEQQRPGDNFSNRYLASWKRAEERILGVVRDKLDALPFSNLSVMHRIISALPPGTVLHLANSATIRYSHLAPHRSDLNYFANRGTSGIDGSVSTAVGAAMVSRGLHLLVVGDLSFVYDSNALWNKDFPENLKIVVLNDGGGGIFRLLDGPDRMAFFEEFSVTHHPVSVELLGQAFGRVARRVSGHDQLEEGLKGLLGPGGSGNLLEVDTTGSENSRIFKDFLNF
ncbi:MAG: 2-succinyl-5-enolpyruvyl-6-hydroxy-3-cyclohexene-1-carboxylic-acid synthase [Bacteroidota bacterium]